jgi:hypothetical protein
MIKGKMKMIRVHPDVPKHEAHNTKAIIAKHRVQRCNCPTTVIGRCVGSNGWIHNCMYGKGGGFERQNGPNWKQGKPKRKPKKKKKKPTKTKKKKKKKKKRHSAGEVRLE